MSLFLINVYLNFNLLTQFFAPTKTLLKTTVKTGERVKVLKISREKFHPTCLFILSKKSTHPAYSTHPYYFSLGNFPPTPIIPATPIIPDSRVSIHYTYFNKFSLLNGNCKNIKFFNIAQKPHTLICSFRQKFQTVQNPSFILKWTGFATLGKKKFYSSYSNCTKSFFFLGLINV